MTMTLNTAHDLLVTIHNSCDTPKVAAIIGAARYQLEIEIAGGCPKMLDLELGLPTKQLRVAAYQKRTKVSSTTAHAVANVAWRSSIRSAA